MTSFTKNGHSTENTAGIKASEYVKGPHTGKMILRPEDSKIHLEYECKYNGLADDIHAPCNGAWHPWTDFNLHKTRGIQDVCKDCGALRSRNWRRRQNMLSPSAIEYDRQAKIGREMSENEAGNTRNVASVNFEPQSTAPDSTLPANQPSEAEIHRVATYLLNFSHRSAELDLAKKTIEAIEAEVVQLQKQVEKLNQDSQAMLDLAAQQERDTEALNQRIAELNNALALQEEYQRKLSSVGIRIPSKYKLFVEED